MFAALDPVGHRTLADSCYERLKGAILSLDLPPNTPLDEGQLAAQLGVSKTPVREALARLSGEGFVVGGAGRRSFVADLSLDLIREIYQVRIMLETAAVREIAVELSDASLATLSECVDETSRALAADDLAGFLAASGRFHRALIEQTGNRFLMTLTRGLSEHARRVTAAIFRAEQQGAQHRLSTEGVETHRRILQALVVRDADEAARLIRYDIQASLDAISTSELQAVFGELGWRPPGDSERRAGEAQAAVDGDQDV